METKIDTRLTPKRGPWLLVATLWAGFAALALVIHRVIGCRLAGCSDSMIALAAGVTLAFTLGTLLTHSDRVAAHRRSRPGR